jgi:outer membrane protein
MHRLYRLIFLSAFILLSYSTIAQEGGDVWTLQRCVQYALDHNISIQQNVLNERLAKLTLRQSQLAQLPSANLNGGYGRSAGRSIDPTTNTFIDASYNFVNASGSANVLLFGWFQQRNLISKNKLSLQAAQADLDQLKDDVSLNVATGFLRALLAQEQIAVNEKQVELSKAQLDQTKKFADVGRVPELNVAQLESQVATDSANYISAISNYNSAILDLKALLNLDFETPFKLQAPNVKVDDQVKVSAMVPEEIYAEAQKHFGSIRGAEYRYSAAQKGWWSARGGLLPQLSVGAQFGTNYASSYKQVSYQPSGSVDTTGITTTGDFVLAPGYKTIESDVPFGKQLSNNFRQTVSLNLNIPLFNAWQSQYNVRQAKINMANQELNIRQAELTLKQNVYKAYNDAISSIQKYYAALHAAEAAERAQDFARKRYDLGLTSTVDYLQTQNTQYSAEANLVSAKYDLIFKLKVIDYYLGKELKL